MFLISTNHIPDPRSLSNHVRRRLISELMITSLPSKSKTTIWDDKQTDNLNFIWLFILQNQPDNAAMALKMDQSELDMISKLNADLIGGMASVLDDLSSHWLPTTANQNLFQVLADVFCHFVEIIESNIISCIDYRYAEFHLAANYIQRAFIPINQLIKFRKTVEKFFKKVISKNINSALMIVLFTELVEAIQKFLTLFSRLSVTLEQHNTNQKIFCLSRDALLPAFYENPEFVLEEEIENVRYGLRIGDFAIDISSIEGSVTKLRVESLAHKIRTYQKDRNVNRYIANTINLRQIMFMEMTTVCCSNNLFMLSSQMSCDK